MIDTSSKKTNTVGRPSICMNYEDPHSYPEGAAFVDGQYIPVSKAKISVLDWGFLHSDATYDTVHVWNGKFFRLDLHLDRFFHGMEELRMDISMTREDVVEVLSNCVALSGHKSAYVEMICTRGTSPVFSRDPREAVNRFMAFAVPYGSVVNEEQMARGMHAAISQVVRIPPTSIDPTIKNYHWLDLVRGMYDAFDSKAETAFVLDSDGNIAEGPGFNVFSVKDGRLLTPEKGVLPGITRQSVFDLCKENGIAIVAGPLAVDVVRQADEVFITSTAGGIMPITKIDNQKVGGGKVGSMTKRLTDFYWQKHEDPIWSTSVDYWKV